MMQLGILNVLQQTLLKGVVKSDEFTLPADLKSYTSIRASGQCIQVRTGNAWITCNGEDILLEAGQEMRLPRNRREVIISAIGSETVTFEFIKHLSNSR